MNISGIDESINAPIANDIKATMRNFPFNLISGLSDLSVSREKIKPIIKKITIKEIKKISMNTPYTIWNGVENNPI